MKKRIFTLLISIFMLVGVLPISVLATESHEHSNDGGYNFTELDGGKHRYTCSCGEEITEDCIFSLLDYDDTEHWTGCNYCRNSSNREAHTMVDCECESCDYNAHVVAEWLSTDDPTFHSGWCSACQRDVSEYHNWVKMYTETEHWWGCECGYEEDGSRTEHTFSDWLNYGGGKHYKDCSDCPYSLYEPHTDADNDGVCDVETCGATVCYDADGNHICDDCGVLLNNLCTDANENHICDVMMCKAQMEWKCVDDNGDHVCDVAACGTQLHWECVDENNDHLCDVSVCARYMKENCMDDDGDSICDDCERNCCYHYVENAWGNGDGTHSGICYDCGDFVTVDCDTAYGSDYDETHHYSYCDCGNRFLEKEHTYEEELCYVRSLAGHWIECDVCPFEYYEAHTESSGTCEICELELTETFDVYVGGVGLKDGQYMDNSGNVTATKPEGGYAYYQDGVLELNGFVYEGVGVMWQEADYFESYAPIFAAKDLILKLTGENRLSSTATTEEDDFYVYGDGIATVGSLTVKGEGSLTVVSTDDGINVKDGDFTMESGTLKLGELAYNEDGSPRRDGKIIIDDGIDVDNGDLNISGGTVNIHAYDHGFDVSGAITVSGGVLNFVVGDDGIEANETVTIAGGQINIHADDEMIRGSQVTISISKTDTDGSGNTNNEGNTNNDGNANSDGNANTNDVGSEAPDAESDGLSGGAIAGITAGSIALAEVGGFSIFWFVVKKKKFADLIAIFRK